MRSAAEPHRHATKAAPRIDVSLIRRIVSRAAARSTESNPEAASRWAAVATTCQGEGETVEEGDQIVELHQLAPWNKPDRQACSAQVRRLVDRDDRADATACRGDPVDARVVGIEEAAGLAEAEHVTQVAVDHATVAHHGDALTRVSIDQILRSRSPTRTRNSSDVSSSVSH